MAPKNDKKPKNGDAIKTPDLGAADIEDEPPVPTDFDVVIIGGGLSGLTAAHTLKKRIPEIRFCVLEAEHRCGGQILTEDKFESGARWFTEDQTHIMDLCNDLGVFYQEKIETVDKATIRPSNLDLSDIYQTNHRSWQIDDSLMSGAANFELDRFLRYVDVLCKEYPPELFHGDISQGLTMERFLCNSLWFDDSRNFVRLLVQAACGMPAKHVSFKEYMVVCCGTNGITNQLNGLIGEGKQLRIMPEFDTLIQKLIESVGESALKKDSKVTVVEHTHNVVTITYANDTKITCATVIVAIPLQAIHSIHFDPDLPKQYISGHLRQANLVKSFTCDLGPEIRAIVTPPKSIVLLDPKLVACPVDEKGHLCGMVFTNAPVEDQHAHSIKETFLSKILQDVPMEQQANIRWHEKSWTPNMLCGLPTNHRWERILWAGSNAGILYRGYCNGAVQSGKSSAMAALKILRPGKIGYVDTVQKANVVKEPTCGFFERTLMSLNLYNCTFYGLVVAPAVGLSTYYTCAHWDSLKGLVS